eukprot:3754069-Rhodomonas_salina.3
MDTLLSQTKKLWQAAKGGASCTNDGPEDEDKDTEEALSKEPVCPLRPFALCHGASCFHPDARYLILDVVLDNPPRVRVVPRREGGGSNRAARTTTAVRYHMSLMDEEEVRADQATASAQSRQSTAPAAAVNGGSEGAKSDDTKRKLEELARAQTEARNTVPPPRPLSSFSMFASGIAHPTRSLSSSPALTSSALLLLSTGAHET